MLWFEKVVPSLLPFMITANCLMYLNFPAFFGNIAQSFFLNLFNLSGTCAFPLFVGLTAGFPMGLKTTAQLYKNGSITKAEAHRLMLFCNNAGAVFIVSTVGVGFFGSAKAGFFLLASAWSAILLLAVVSGLIMPPAAPVRRKASLNAFSQKILADSVSDAVISTLMIGGYIILFSVLNEIFSVLHIYDGLSRMLAPLGIVHGLDRAAAAGIMELTNGCSLAAGRGKANIITTAAIIGWGGFSVHAQSIEFLNDSDLDVRFYFLGKILTCALTAAAAFFLWKYFFG